MTPKEKSDELIEKFIFINGNSFFAKDCAIIAVDEIIENLHWLEDSINFDKAIRFWNEVKTELENLKNL